MTTDNIYLFVYKDGFSHIGGYLSEETFKKALNGELQVFDITCPINVLELDGVTRDWLHIIDL